MNMHAQAIEATTEAQADDADLLTVTTFTDLQAKSQELKRIPIEDLLDLIETTTAAMKAKLPLLKFARFGDKKNDKGCLRHNENVEELFGVEGDIDGGLSVDQACDIIKKSGAITYTSPSHTDACPKLRILTPTSCPLPPERHTQLVARLNGLFGGKLDNKSFTLSQSYYFGSVKNNPAHRVELFDGRKFYRQARRLRRWRYWTSVTTI